MAGVSDAERADKAASFGCATLVDALGRVHEHRAHILAMASPDPARTLFGPATTIAYLPYRDDLPQKDTGFGRLFAAAIQGQAAGRVLVLSSGGYPEVSHGGGTKLARVQREGLAGVLADGRLRDFDQLRDYSFATWCRGEATHAGGDTVMPFAANIAVEIAGVTVTPGDFVYADAAGAVIIPAGSLAEVFEQARAVEREDADTAARLLDETPP